MNYSVQLTSSVTGEVQVLDVEASSEEEAIGMFDAAKYAVTIIRINDEQQASRERIEQLREEAKRVEKAQANGLVPLIVLVLVAVAFCFAFVLSGAIGSSTKKPSRSQKSSGMSDTEKALWIKVLTDD